MKGMMKNHRLAKSMENTGWGRLTAYIEYKATSAGKMPLKFHPITHHNFAVAVAERL
ncbi:hypothetical protein [Sulfoacidibacillus ferrooxidans]|uniref:Uncharacterized protein n=1 Tax=Sulfoacidibacillus ferrooxidans TaxID=2005001 RepID=A0A9X2AFX6_9BACL|nr:hypothetical protein [Sulfoacidibacillus ferrooxidans]MCI0184526.1 hypothetical protein [Sulfoacidibacillus ferrooxidans]